ncbi:hypothetical protein DKP78_22815, partial [Enterococcus faecium]
MPDAVVTGSTGRSTSFEVKVNDQLVYSKLRTHGFPDTKEIVKAVQKVSSGEEAGM